MALLFTTNTTRQDTQLAYKVKCFPWKALSDTAKRLIAWRRQFTITKEDFLGMLSEDLNTLIRDGKCFKIIWAYQCVPTEIEWNKKHGGTMLSVDLRVSPAIAEGPVAVLEFAPAASLALRTGFRNKQS